MEDRNYRGSNKESIKINSAVEVSKELEGTETVYTIQSETYQQAVYLKPETAKLVIEALTKLLKNKRLEYKKAKGECIKVSMSDKIGK